MLFSKLRPYLAKSLLVREQSQGTGEFLCMEPGVETDSRFLLYATLSRPWLDHADMTSFGSKMPRTSWEAMASFRFYRPSLEDQRRIADFLDQRVSRIDAILSLRSKQAQLLRARYESLVSERLVGEPAPRVPLRRMLAEAVVGIVVQPAALYTDDGGVPALRGVDVRERDIGREGHVALTLAGHAANPRSHLRNGDVVVVRTGDAGTAALVPEWAVGWNCVDLLVVRAATGTFPAYVELVINMAKAAGDIGYAASGALHQHFGVGALRDLEVPGLSLAQQMAVCADAGHAWAAMNEARGSLTRSIELLTEYKRALITAAVSGELDVTTSTGRSIPA